MRPKGFREIGRPPVEAAHILALRREGRRRKPTPERGAAG
jgi:hypothetical protein